jgi:uncharacterized protein YrrD
VTTIKASALKGRAVVSLAQAEKVGSVSTVIFDPATARVVGVKVRTSLLGGAKTLRASDIHSVGDDAITINDRGLLHDHESDAPETKDMPTLEDLLAIKVVSQSGRLLGALGDVEIDPEQFHIVRYEMSGTLWNQITNSRPGFDAVGGLRFGKDLLIVPDDIMAEIQGQAGESGDTGAQDREAALPAPSTVTPPAAGPSAISATFSPMPAESAAPAPPSEAAPAPAPEPARVIPPPVERPDSSA